MPSNITLASVFANLEELKKNLDNTPDTPDTDARQRWNENCDKTINKALGIDHDSSPAARAEEAIERMGITDPKQQAFIHEHERLHDEIGKAPTGWDVAETSTEDDDQSANTFTHVADVAAPLVRKAIQVKGLDEKAVLVQLKRSMFGTSKRDDAESEAYGAGNVTKHLFEDKTCRMAVVKSAYSEVYTYTNENTVPWAKGVRMLNIDHYMDFTSGLRQRIDKANAAVSDLVNNWDYEVQKDLARLSAIEQAKGRPTGSLADADNYPHASEIGDRFGIEVRYMPVPTAGDFRVNISDEDKASLQKQLEDAEDAAAKHVIREMLEPMERAIEKLNVPIGADGSVFRDSLIDNIVATAERMERVNLSDDPSVTDKIAELKSLATTYANNKDMLRKAPDVRKKAASQISELMGQMAGLV